MADYTPTAANVKWNSGTRPVLGVAGATVTAPNVLYKDTSDGEWKLYDADNDPTGLELAVALSNGYDGRHVILAKRGANINIGFTTTAGEPIVASAANAGEVAPEGDLTTGDWVVIVAIGNGTANVELLLDAGSAAHA